MAFVNPGGAQQAADTCQPTEKSISCAGRKKSSFLELNKQLTDAIECIVVLDYLEHQSFGAEETRLLKEIQEFLRTATPSHSKKTIIKLNKTTRSPTLSSITTSQFILSILDRLNDIPQFNAGKFFKCVFGMNDGFDHIKLSDMKRVLRRQRLRGLLSSYSKTKIIKVWVKELEDYTFRFSEKEIARRIYLDSL